MPYCLSSDFKESSVIFRWNIYDFHILCLTGFLLLLRETTLDLVNFLCWFFSITSVLGLIATLYFLLFSLNLNIIFSLPGRKPWSTTSDISSRLWKDVHVASITENTDLSINYSTQFCCKNIFFPFLLQ